MELAYEQILELRANHWFGHTGNCDWCGNVVRFDKINRMFDDDGQWLMVQCFRCMMTDAPVKDYQTCVVNHDEPF